MEIEAAQMIVDAISDLEANMSIVGMAIIITNAAIVLSLAGRRR